MLPLLTMVRAQRIAGKGYFFIDGRFTEEVGKCGCAGDSIEPTA